MIGGIDADGKSQLHQIDPSGIITCYKANAIGKNAKQIIELLEQNYKETLTLEEGIRLMCECFMKNIDSPKTSTEIMIIQKD